MLVGVLSDTHDNVEAAIRAARIFRERGVGLVIHLGDFVAPFTLRALLNELEGVKLVGVYGNNDGEKLGLALAASQFGGEIHEPPYELEAAGKRILLVHGFGSPEATVRIVEALARGGEWDAVLYGHTHRVDNRMVDSTLILNPGEAGGKLERPSIAVLDLDSMQAEVIPL